jgi:Carboxypeptidase regulatory-like domain
MNSALRNYFRSRVPHGSMESRLHASANIRVPVLTLVLSMLFGVASAAAQSVASGTVEGKVVDQTGAVIGGATVEIRNPVSGYQQTATTDANGEYRFTNVPFNNYSLTATHSGLSSATQNVSVRSVIPLTVEFKLALASVKQSVTVQASAADILENVPNAHSDVDASTLLELPIATAGAGLSEAITMVAVGVVADSNGFFHPLGDHASYSMQLDGQPINDQFSKNFSTQIPLNALQSTELITGFPSAEYGEKTSLIINATTRSGLGMGTPHGSVVAQYGSFGTVGGEANIGFGTQRFGEFLALNGTRSGRFLDTPEFTNFHDIGNSGSVFDRLDFQPDPRNVFHLDLFAARNWFQIPNTYDQVPTGQDQQQRVLSFDIAPGYQHTFSDHLLATVHAWARHDQVNYYPSRDVFDDIPATIAQQRLLLSLGGRVEVAYSRGKHNVKAGTQFMQTRLAEHFGLGLTDPAFNAVCVDANGNPDPSPTPTDPNLCPSAGAGFTANPGFVPGLLSADLTRGGTIFHFNATGSTNEYTAYITDSINWGQFTLSPGLRVTDYNGLAHATSVQPRIGVSYFVKRTGTVLRASYARTLETPANENLLLSSSTGVGGIGNEFGAFGQTPVPASHRNQFNVGFQQSLGRFAQVDADYYWKYADPAFEFDVILNTPITFPIAWKKDKLDGLGVRITTLDLAGFRLNTTFSTGRLRYFPPETGGLLFNAPIGGSVFRTDSDDKFYQTTSLIYHYRKTGVWAGLTWRYDNGQVSGGGGDLDSTLALDADEQAQMGFFCGSDVATPVHQITSCNLPFPQYGATRVQMPAPGTANDDTNPPRVASRHLFDIGVGTDNLLRSTESRRITLRFTIVNLTNKEAMYNFLSTFGGTHFVQPRSYQGRIGFTF